MADKEVNVHNMMIDHKLDDIVREEYGKAFIKILLATIPVIGPALNEIIDARSSVKQKRVENFIQEFVSFLETQSGQNITLESLNQESIGDIFEEIIISASKTASEEKRKLFRNILYNSLDKKSIETDNILKFINITNRLSLLQVSILKMFDLHGDQILEIRLRMNKVTGLLNISKNKKVTEKQRSDQGLANNLKTSETEYNKTQIEHSQLQNELNRPLNPNYSKLYGLEDDELEAEIQDLIATGLLYQWNSRQQPPDVYVITKQGRKYIEYIKSI